MAHPEGDSGQNNLGESILNRPMSRRRAVQWLGSTAVGAAAIALIGCGDNSQIPEGTQVEADPTSNTEVSLENAVIVLDILPDKKEEIIFPNAIPQNLVIRKGSVLETHGIFTDEEGIRRTIINISDPLRKNAEGSDQKFVGIIPAETNPELINGNDTSYNDLITANGGTYEVNNGKPIVGLSDGKRVVIPMISADVVTSEKEKSGIFFVDRDPLKKDHPLLEKPVVPIPDKSLLPDGGTITQLEDGRVVTKDANGKVVARAITQRGLEWRWTKKEHLINDFGMSEYADALGLVIGAHAFYPNYKNSEWQEAFMGVANKMRIDAPMWNRNQFSSNIDWNKILNNWDSVQADFKNGKIPFETEVFDPYNGTAADDMLEVAKKMNMPVVASKLFWFSDFGDELKSNQFTPEQKKKMVEFKVKAKVLKYKGRVNEWTVAPEFIYNELWAPAVAKQTLATVGGRQMFHDVHRWTKEMDPEVTTTFVEDRLMDANYAPNVDYQKKVFDLLGEAKAKGTPIDNVAPENNFWIYAPPTQADMESVFQRIEGMGFGTSMAQTTIEQSEKCSTAGIDRPRTVSTVADKDAAQAKTVVDCLNVYNTLGKNGKKREFGFFSIDDATGWFGPEAKSQILGDNYKPKSAYTEGVKTLKALLAAS